MPQLLYLNKTECAVLATALNAAKPSSYPEHQRGLIGKVGRRISNFLIDGQTSEDNQATPKKKLIGFAKVRAEDKELQQLYADIDASLPTPLLSPQHKPTTKK
jgi:hypothetical protein